MQRIAAFGQTPADRQVASILYQDMNSVVSCQQRQHGLKAFFAPAITGRRRQNDNIWLHASQSARLAGKDVPVLAQERKERTEQIVEAIVKCPEGTTVSQDGRQLAQLIAGKEIVWLQF